MVSMKDIQCLCLRSWLFLVLATIPCYTLGQGSLLLVGGGTEGANGDTQSWSYQPYAWLADFAANDTLIVLSQSSNTSIDSYFSSLGAQKVILRTIEDEATETGKLIDAASAVFLRGGDQAVYLNIWNDTAVEEALQNLYERGGAIGGTSAGAMVLSEFTSFGGPYSSDNLSDPFNEHNEIAADFLPLLSNYVVDTHHFQRARSGRLLGYLAFIQQRHQRLVNALGIDAHTAVTIDSDGQAEVHGAGAVQLCVPTGSTKIPTQPGEALQIESLPCRQLTDGFRFAVATGALLDQPKAHETVTSADLTTSWKYHLNFRSNMTSEAQVTSLHEQDGSVPWLVLSDHANQLPDAFQSYDQIEFASISTGNELSQSRNLTTLVNQAQRIFLDIQSFDVLQQLLKENGNSDNLLRTASLTGTPLEIPTTHFEKSGVAYITNAAENEYIAEDGLLEDTEGLNLLPDMVVVLDALRAEEKDPRGEFYPDRRDNLASAVGWLMHTYQAHAAFIGNHVVEVEIDGTQFKARVSPNADGSQIPTRIWDATSGYLTATNPFDVSPETDQPRNSAAVSKYHVTVLPSGQTFDWSQKTTSIDRPDPHTRPTRFQINRLYPNPFNPTTTLAVSLTRPTALQLSVYSMAGQQLEQRQLSTLNSGTHRIHLDLSPYSSGCYLISLDDGQQRVTQKALLLK
jgi:cyanophycinase